MTDRVRIRVIMDGKHHIRTLMDRGREVCEVSYVDTLEIMAGLLDQLKAGKSGEYVLRWAGEEIEMSFFDAAGFVATTSGGLIFSN